MCIFVCVYIYVYIYRANPRSFLARVSSILELDTPIRIAYPHKRVDPFTCVFFFFLGRRGPRRCLRGATRVLARILSVLG